MNINEQARLAKERIDIAARYIDIANIPKDKKDFIKSQAENGKREIEQLSKTARSGKTYKQSVNPDGTFKMENIAPDESSTLNQIQQISKKVLDTVYSATSKTDVVYDVETVTVQNPVDPVLAETNARLVLENALIAGQRNALLLEQTRLENEVRDRDAIIAGLNGQIAALNLNIGNLNAQILALTNANGVLTGENARLTQNLADRTLERDNAIANLGVVQAALLQAQADLAAAQAALAPTQAALLQARNDLAEETRKLHDEQKKVADAKTEERRLTDELDAKEAALQAALARLGAAAPLAGAIPPPNPVIPAAPPNPVIPAAPPNPVIPAAPPNPVIPAAPPIPVIPAAPPIPVIPAAPPIPVIPAAVAPAAPNTPPNSVPPPLGAAPAPAIPAPDEVKKLLNEIDVLKKELADAEQKLDVFKRRGGIQKRITELETINKELESKNKNLERTVNATRTKNIELEKKIQDLEQEIKNANEKSDRIRTHLQENARIIRTQKEQIDKLQKDKVEMQKELDEKKEQNDRLVKEKDKYKKDIETLYSLIEKMNKYLVSIRAIPTPIKFTGEQDTKDHVKDNEAAIRDLSDVLDKPDGVKDNITNEVETKLHNRFNARLNQYKADLVRSSTILFNALPHDVQSIIRDLQGGNPSAIDEINTWKALDANSVTNLHIYQEILRSTDLWKDTNKDTKKQTIEDIIKRVIQEDFPKSEKKVNGGSNNAVRGGNESLASSLASIPLFLQYSYAALILFLLIIIFMIGYKIYETQLKDSKIETIYIYED